MLDATAILTAHAPAPIGPYSQAIRVDGFVFCSGQLGVDPKTGTIVEGGVAAQARQALDNLSAVLKSADLTLESIVKTTIFLVDMNDFAAVNAVYGERMGTPPPARSTVAVAALPLGGAAPDPARVALRHALAADAAAGCSSAELASIVADAGLTTIGRIGAQPVVLASPHGSCLCGNVNCPYLVLQIDAAAPAASRVLLSTYAYDVAPAGAARPLPDLRERAHDSALVSDETIDAYRNGAYTPVSNVRVRGDTGERKPLSVPLRFAPGASAAPIAGRISAGWSDSYGLAAARGQRLTIGAVHGPADLTFSLVPAGGNGSSIELAPGVPALLPVTGSYHLLVDTGSDATRAYRATVTIR